MDRANGRIQSGLVYVGLLTSDHDHLVPYGEVQVEMVTVKYVVF